MPHDDTRFRNGDLIPDRETRAILREMMQAATAMHVARENRDRDAWHKAHRECEAAKAKLRERVG